MGNFCPDRLDALSLVARRALQRLRRRRSIIARCWKRAELPFGRFWGCHCIMQKSIEATRCQTLRPNRAGLVLLVTLGRMESTIHSWTAVGLGQSPRPGHLRADTLGV